MVLFNTRYLQVPALGLKRLLPYSTTSKQALSSRGSVVYAYMLSARVLLLLWFSTPIKLFSHNQPVFWEAMQKKRTGAGFS